MGRSLDCIGHELNPCLDTISKLEFGGCSRVRYSVFHYALGCLGIRTLSTVLLTENRNLTDDAEIEKAIKFGEYIKEGGSFTQFKMPSTDRNIK